MKWPSDKKLILLPGLDGTGLLFNALLAELPAECKTEIIHYPSRQLLTFDEHVQYVSKRLPQNEPIILLAESFSGPVAAEIVKMGRHRIEKVFFAATFLKSPRPRLLSLASRLPLMSILKRRMPDFLVRHLCLGSKAPVERIESFRDALKKVAPEVVAQRIKILANVDAAKGLSSISVPCCYIQATHDRLVPRRALEDFHQSINHINTRTLKGPHFILQASPKEAAAMICAEAVQALCGHSAAGNVLPVH